MFTQLFLFFYIKFIFGQIRIWALPLLGIRIKAHLPVSFVTDPSNIMRIRLNLQHCKEKKLGPDPTKIKRILWILHALDPPRW